METLQLEEQIVKMLRTVYDPEIPVNIYDLGLIYNVDIQDEGAKVVITMTLTAPNCPAADFILQDVQIKVESIKGVKRCDIELTFDPPWDSSMMSEEAQLELGFLEGKSLADTLNYGSYILPIRCTPRVALPRRP